MRRCAHLLRTALLAVAFLQPAEPFSHAPVPRAALAASARPRGRSCLHGANARARFAGLRRSGAMSASQAGSSAREAPTREAIESELADLFASGIVQLWRKVFAPA
jgi:hypothetical protein